MIELSFRLSLKKMYIINVEKLFIESTKISTRFNFAYRGNAIHITLNKLNLEKHYLYYIFELLNYIEKTKNS